MLSKIKNIYHFLLAWIGAIMYRHPSKQLYVIGITGTKGKSTTTELLAAVLDVAGKKTALLSSVHIKIGGVYQKNLSYNTMPGRLFIQRWLRQAADAGCEYAILEVTSQGVVQHRHRFIDFDVAAMTCLHREHIESHGSFEAYRAAKVQFFRDVARRSSKQDKLFFINTDAGSNTQYFAQAVLHPTGSGNFGETIFYTKEDFVQHALGGDVAQLGDWLSSGFNLENAAAVHAIARRQGLSNKQIIEAMGAFKGVSGRMELIVDKEKQKTVVVDFALTPDSLKAVYAELRHRMPRKGKLIAVFGSAGGGRDTWKRKELGAIAAEACDDIILTTDDPYDEDPRVICEEIKNGIPAARSAAVRIILDRAEAIKTAIMQAGPHDVVAVTGMGSLAHLCGPKGSSIPWNEREVVEGILRNI